MLARLLLLFTIIPIVELAILIPLGDAIGIWPTVALVVTTGVLGAVLAKHQGMAAWRRLQHDLGEGRMPGDSLLDGLAVLIAGAFLVTPGVLTDVAGMFLLIPPLRRPLKLYLKKRFKHSITSGSVSHISMDGSSPGSPFGPGGPTSGPDHLDTSDNARPANANTPQDKSSPFEDGEVIDVTPDEPKTSNSERQRLN
jgi:UPF0716 protein FxsA